MHWNDLRKLVSPRLSVVKDEPDFIRGVCGKVEIKVQRVGDLVVLLANMGAVRGLSLQGALELNNQIVHGALALEGSTYVLRRVVELALLDGDLGARLLDRFIAEAQKVAEGMAALNAPMTNAAARDVALAIWAA